MKRRFVPRFRLRTLMVATAIVALVAHTAIRYHTAATFIEETGGDVWVGDRLYTEYEFGVPKRGRLGRFVNRSLIVGRMLAGEHSNLWVSYVPEQREELGSALATLNPNEITFDVISRSDRAWVLAQFPDVELSTVCEIPGDSVSDRQDAAGATTRMLVPPTTASDFVHSFDSIDTIDTDSKRLYRAMRYETRIGYPEHGEMGRLYDNHKWKTIYLPWPDSTTEPSVGPKNASKAAWPSQRRPRVLGQL